MASLLIVTITETEQAAVQHALGSAGWSAAASPGLHVNRRHIDVHTWGKPESTHTITDHCLGGSGNIIAAQVAMKIDAADQTYDYIILFGCAAKLRGEQSEIGTTVVVNAATYFENGTVESVEFPTDSELSAESKSYIEFVRIKTDRLHENQIELAGALTDALSGELGLLKAHALCVDKVLKFDPTLAPRTYGTTGTASGHPSQHLYTDAANDTKYTIVDMETYGFLSSFDTLRRKSMAVLRVITDNMVSHADSRGSGPGPDTQTRLLYQAADTHLLQAIDYVFDEGRSAIPLFDTSDAIRTALALAAATTEGDTRAARNSSARASAYNVRRWATLVSSDKAVGHIGGHESDWLTYMRQTGLHGYGTQRAAHLTEALAEDDDWLASIADAVARARFKLTEGDGVSALKSSYVDYADIQRLLDELIKSVDPANTAESYEFALRAALDEIWRSNNGDNPRGRLSITRELNTRWRILRQDAPDEAGIIAERPKPVRGRVLRSDKHPPNGDSDLVWLGWESNPELANRISLYLS